MRSLRLAQSTAVQVQQRQRPHDGPIPRDLVKQIATDIGKAVAHHIETMYPKAVTGAGPNMLVSVRGCVYNEIMSALDTTDVDAIIERLTERKRHRRKIKAMYANLRKTER